MKIETTTPDKPEVVKIATLLGIDQDAVTGKLLRIWAWADANCIDGHAIDITPAFLDRLTHCPGFTRAMIAVGWLHHHEESGLTFPNFRRHNGTTAKARAESNRRTAQVRSARKTGSGNVAEKALQKPLPEKRREEDGGSSDSGGEIPPDPSPDTTCGTSGSQEPPTPADIARYGGSLPMAFPPEAATAFHDTMLATGWTSKHGHPIRDWRAAFRRYLSVWNQREQHLPPGPHGRGHPPIRRPPAATTTLEPMEWEK